MKRSKVYVSLQRSQHRSRFSTLTRVNKIVTKHPHTHETNQKPILKYIVMFTALFIEICQPCVLCKPSFLGYATKVCFHKNLYDIKLYICNDEERKKKNKKQ